MKTVNYNYIILDYNIVKDLMFLVNLQLLTWISELTCASIGSLTLEGAAMSLVYNFETNFVLNFADTKIF